MPAMNQTAQASEAGALAAPVSQTERIASLDGWERIVEDDHVIALRKDGASITLEPGGQLELSGAPLRTIHETWKELRDHLDLVARASEPVGIAWLALGIQPFHSVEKLPMMPKERYRIMRRYLPTRGSRGLVMMFATATVQANLDYASEADMVEKVRIDTRSGERLSENKAVPGGYFYRDDTWHYIEYLTRPAELYRVVDDPDEERDLAAQEPQLVARFRAQITAWDSRLRARVPPDPYTEEALR